MSAIPNALFGSHFLDFKCIGDQCEDTCCAGWKVDVDRDTYYFYKSNQHLELQALFKSAVIRTKSGGTKQRYATLTHNEKGECSFLEHGLCKIQKTLGSGALSKTCTNYPRRKNQFGNQSEYSLGLSCPEAARLILLDKEKMSFQEGPAQNDESEKLPPPASPERLSALNDIRAIVIFTLQHRDLSLDTRLLLVGLLLEAIDQNAYPLDRQSLEKLPGIMENFYQTLSHGEKFEKEIKCLPTEDKLRLKIFAEIMNANPNGTNRRFSACLGEAADGLLIQPGSQPETMEILANMNRANEEFLQPFLQEHPHILENYLVHTVFHSLFPCREEPLIQQYLRLVCHYLILRICLLGLAAKHKGMTEALAVRLIQSYARHSEHNTTYPGIVLSILEKNEFSQFRKIFLLLIDSSPKVQT